MVNLSKRTAVEEDKELARSVHHLGYRDVVTRQFGEWNEAEQDGFFEGDWISGRFQILTSDSTPCGYLSVEEKVESVSCVSWLSCRSFNGRALERSSSKKSWMRPKHGGFLSPFKYCMKIMRSISTAD